MRSDISRDEKYEIMATGTCFLSAEGGEGGGGAAASQEGRIFFFFFFVTGMCSIGYK